MNLAVMVLLAAEAVGLTPVQQQQVQRLNNTLMAPCCYTQTIGEHRSAEAEQMRQEVEAMVVAGKSDQEIKNFYRAKYGETILVVPEGRTGSVAYGVPIALGGFALVLLAALIRRRRRPVEQTVAVAAEGKASPMVERIRRDLGEPL